MADLSHLVSIETLVKHCSAWCEKRFGSRPWFPGITEKPSDLAGVLDIVLFGDCLSRLQEIRSWPKNNFRLWVLSSAAKELSSNILGIPKPLIGVIPRYELLPRRVTERQFPKKETSWSFVYAGRIAPAKNLGFCLQVVSHLQNEFRESVGFVCFGSVSDEGYDQFRHIARTYGEYLSYWRTKLKFSNAPLFIGALEKDEWLNYPIQRPVFLSLSTYYREDFGLAAAESQERGWPCILSDWGGHRDIQGENVIKVPSHLIANPSESDAVQLGKSYAVAETIALELMQFRNRSQTLHKERRSKFQTPTQIDCKKVEKIQSEIKKRCPQLRGKLSNPNRFYDRQYRRDPLYNQYIQAFSGASKQGQEILLACHDRLNKWTSLEEILPAVEMSWMSLNGFQGISVVRFPITRGGFLRWLPRIAKARAIVFTEINPDAVKLLRQDFGIRTPILIHTHGEATAGLIGYRACSKILSRGDVFICASAAESRSIKMCLPESKTKVAPFALLNAKQGIDWSEPTENVSCLVYVGRISEQKNLHLLLVALWLINRHREKLRPKLHIFGSVDNLGTPEMGVGFRSYFTYLQKIERKLGLKGQIIWHGATPRAEIEKFYSTNKCLFVSPSLHQHEDFGTAALTALVCGKAAVLSNWGGHSDFAKNFQTQVRLVRVYESKIGRYICPQELAVALVKQLQKTQNEFPRQPKPFPYSLSRVRQNLYSALETSTRSAKMLKPSCIVETIYSRLDEMGPWKGQLDLESPASALFPVFEGYTDKLSYPIARAYGMKKRAFIRAFERQKLRLAMVPWVEIKKDKILIDDPRRGSFTIAKVKNHEEELQKLLEIGVAFPDLI